MECLIDRGPYKISKLVKGNVAYSYSRTGQYAWTLISDQDETIKSIFEFKGVPYRGTRLVDLRLTGEQVEVLLFHSQGYRYTLLNKEGDSWAQKRMADIILSDFVKNSLRGRGEFHTNITSVSIGEDHKISLVRQQDGEASSEVVYNLDPEAEQHEDVYFLIK